MVGDVDKVQTHVRNFLLFEATAAATDSKEDERHDDNDDDDDIVTLDTECRLGRRELLSRRGTTGPMRSKLLDQLGQKSGVVDRIGNNFHFIISRLQKVHSLLSNVLCSRENTVVDKTCLMLEQNI